MLNRDGLNLYLLISEFDFDISFSVVLLPVRMFSSLCDRDEFESSIDFLLNIDDFVVFELNNDNFDE